MSRIAIKGLVVPSMSVWSFIVLDVAQADATGEYLYSIQFTDVHMDNSLQSNV